MVSGMGTVTTVCLGKASERLTQLKSQYFLFGLCEYAPHIKSLIPAFTIPVSAWQLNYTSTVFPDQSFMAISIGLHGWCRLSYPTTLASVENLCQSLSNFYKVIEPFIM